MRVAIVGVGFMGMVHYLTWQKLAGVEVVAIADPSEAKRAGDWRGIQGNFGPPGEQVDLRGVATYTDARSLIADSPADLIDITLPPALHADAAVESLAADAHVLCEKPMALTLKDCSRMQAAAAASPRRLLIAHVLPYFPEYAWALQEVRSGRHGRALGGSFRRLISDPEWLTHYWDAHRVGGPLLDLHVHDAHFAQMLFGKPSRVEASGSLRGTLPAQWRTTLAFDKPSACVTLECSAVEPADQPFRHGFSIELERATLEFEFTATRDQAAYVTPPTITDAAGARTVDLGDGDPMQAFQRELSHVQRVLTAGAPPDALCPDLARDTLALCHRQWRAMGQ